MISLRSACFVATLSLAAAGVAFAQQKTEQAGGHNESELTFAPVPNLPTCITGAVTKGNPEKTAFFVLAKAEAGCVVPWHWHTASEHVMMITGDATIAMRGQNQGKAMSGQNQGNAMRGQNEGNAMRGQNEGKPVELHAAGFALLPAKHAHEFRCTNACEFYIYSDGKFDIHYIDKNNKELRPAQALEPFKETPGAMPKST